MAIFNSYVKLPDSTPRLDNELNRFAAHFEQSAVFSFATSEGGKKTTQVDHNQYHCQSSSD
jgi:hypothetical protein